ncbi:MAG: flagellar basal body rod protein FlgB [Alphaproteobacteria bacterium]|nr:flagellar basal body rod protein FlgB [Alphaproteobacteria bacterium]
MDLGNHRLFTAISERMSWLTARQTVLARNIANSDTPGYQPRDLQRQDFRGLMASSARLQLASSTGGESLGPVRLASRFQDREQKAKSEVTLSGNAVSLDDELLKIAETGRGYQLVTNLYRKHLALFKTAIARAGG